MGRSEDVGPPPRPTVFFISAWGRRGARGGLGLTEQHERIAAFANTHGFGLARDGLYEEVRESDALDGRPALRRAVDQATAWSSPIIIARLDCLALEPGIVAAVVGRVPVICADLGVSVEPSSLPALTAKLQRRRTFIAERTRQGIAERRQGARKPWGNPAIADAGILGRKAQADDAAARAATLALIIASVRRSGAISLRDIAAELTRRNIPTARGGLWSAQQVARVLRRLQK